MSLDIFKGRLGKHWSTEWSKILIFFIFPYYYDIPFTFFYIFPVITGYSHLALVSNDYYEDDDERPRKW